MIDSKFHLKSVFSNHLETFKGRDNKFTDKDINVFFFFPIITSIVILFIQPELDKFSSNFIICLSVIIGLLLNLLVLLMSRLEIGNVDKTDVEKEERIKLIKETFNNISFSIILSTFLLILLFIYDFKLNVSITNFIKSLNLTDALKISKYVLATITYFFSIQVFLHLFMIIKRIDTLFNNDIK